MNDAQLSQTAGRTKTRQPGLSVKPTKILLSSYLFVFIVQRLDDTRPVRKFRSGLNGVNPPREEICPVNNYECSCLLETGCVQSKIRRAECVWNGKFKKDYRTISEKRTCGLL